MLKSILSIALAALITTGTPAAHVDAMTATKLNSYTENNIKYTAFATSDGQYVDNWRQVFKRQILHCFW